MNTTTQPLSKKERHRIANKIYREKNKEKVKASRKKWNDKHLTEWRHKNREHINSYRRSNHEKRKQTDPSYIIKRRLRRAVQHAFSRIGAGKPTDTLSLLGCSWEEARIHFERLFAKGMSWENHGEWHIDHIRPVSDWKEDELRLMNHISNLQPLWAKDNNHKSDSLFPF